jgi:hypothetical protein
MSKIPAVTLVTAIASFLGGGFAGSVFTWYMNRPDVTILTYNIATTPFGSSEAVSVVPNLRIQIGNENINSLYTHTIDLSVPKGPFVEQTDFAIIFPTGTRVFGTQTVAPTSVQGINCSTISDGLKCHIGPLTAQTNKAFRVIVANDHAEPPRVELAAKNLELLSNQEYLNKGRMPLWLQIIGLGCSGLLGFFLPELVRRLSKRKAIGASVP